MTMYNPPHPGETIRECIEETGWSVTTAAKRLGVSREGLSRVLSGKGGVSPRLAVAMERVGWSTAAQWIRVQGSYNLAQFRLKQKQTAA